MKKIFIIISAVLTFLAVKPFPASAEDWSEAQSELVSEVDELLGDYDIGGSAESVSGLSFGEILVSVRDRAADRLTAPVQMLGTLLAVVLFTAVLQSSGGTFIPQSPNSSLFNMICVLTAVTVITPPLLTVYERALSSITRTGGFISVFVPIFAAVTAAAGGFTSGSAYDILILTASEVVVQLSVRFLMPVLSVTTVLAISGSVFPKASLDSISVLMKKLVTWGLTVAMTLFTGFVSMKCTLTGKADGAATKTAKFMISGFVPVVGSAVSDAYATVRSSLDVMRTTIGAAGTVAVVLIMLPPVLELLAFRAAMWAGAAAADVFSVTPLSKLLKGLDSGLAIAQSVLVCYSVIFVICTGILMNAVN
ncbi:MAG: hypothetical protein IJM44_05445 [Ruminococcus sp.]|nr:hypothetical protein [Ruminococcus sp.]